MKHTIYLFFLLLLTQCQVENTNNAAVKSEKEPQENLYEGYETHILSLIDSKVKIQVPGMDLVNKEPQISIDNSGVTNVVIGKNFHLEILEGELNVEETINDLGKNIFYKTTVLSKDDKQLVYEKSLPDGSKSYVNFIMKKETDGVPIIIRSASNGQYRKAHIDRMIKSASSLEVNNEIVMNN